MVCSPHQYTLQKIAMPYMPVAAYITQNNYLQKLAYQFMPQRELYTVRRTDPQEMSAYLPRQQYAPSYQPNERQRQRNTDENVQFTPPVWTSAKLEQLPASAVQSVTPTWQDYGLPLYQAPRIIDTNQKMKRQDLMQRINEELRVMHSGRKVPEDYLCAA